METTDAEADTVVVEEATVDPKTPTATEDTIAEVEDTTTVDLSAATATIVATDETTTAVTVVDTSVVTAMISTLPALIATLPAVAVEVEVAVRTATPLVAVLMTAVDLVLSATATIVVEIVPLAMLPPQLQDMSSRHPDPKLVTATAVCLIPLLDTPETDFYRRS